MKNEKEKMISGKPYKAFGDELLAILTENNINHYIYKI